MQVACSSDTRSPLLTKHSPLQIQVQVPEYKGLVNTTSQCRNSRFCICGSNTLLEHMLARVHAKLCRAYSTVCRQVSTSHRQAQHVHNPSRMCQCYCVVVLLWTCKHNQTRFKLVLHAVHNCLTCCGRFCKKIFAGFAAGANISSCCPAWTVANMLVH